MSSCPLTCCWNIPRYSCRAKTLLKTLFRTSLALLVNFTDIHRHTLCILYVSAKPRGKPQDYHARNQEENSRISTFQIKGKFQDFHIRNQGGISRVNQKENSRISTFETKGGILWFLRKYPPNPHPNILYHQSIQRSTTLGKTIMGLWIWYTVHTSILW